jgi:hypothetical protein
MIFSHIFLQDSTVEEGLKVLSNENRGGSRLAQDWYQSIHFDKLSCRQVFFSGPIWTPLLS